LLTEDKFLKSGSRRQIKKSRKTKREKTGLGGEGRKRRSRKIRWELGWGGD
jgi:hypothetical protein